MNAEPYNSISQCGGFNTPVKGKNTIYLFFLVLFFFLVFCYLLQGCGPGVKGHGVVLWADTDTGLKNGEIVKIISDSVVQDAYIVYKENPAERVPLKHWRVEVFKTKKAAEEFAARYAPYSSMYAYSKKDGIPPVREIPESGSSVKIISKPKAYQPLKILDKMEQPVRIDEMTDYWYQVLIEYQGIGGDGQYQLLGEKGYCFGHLLEIFETDNDPVSVIQEKLESETSEDPLDILLNNEWRPSYFGDMIRSGRLDLHRFRSAVGLFPEPVNKRIIISRADDLHEFEYTDITRVRYNLYSFQGANVRIEMISNSRISVTYTVDDEQVNDTYILINANIEELIERERNIRDSIYEDFFLRGPVLSSSAYGTIVLNPDKTCSWTGFDKLIPAVIPREISGKGRIDFPYYISPGLKENYDGVITFYFTGYAPKAGVNFLYKKTENGVRLFYVKEDLIVNRKVSRTDLNPMVIFFTFSGS
jgi:hypothetical protein